MIPISELGAAVDQIFAIDNYVHKSPITMSMLGRCRRQAAYALRDGWPAGHEGSSPQAYLGTAIHVSLLVDLAARLGVTAAVEVPVSLDVAGIRLEGTCDLLLPNQVVDLKTTSARWFEVISARLPWSNRLQLTGYAMATDSDLCTLLYINRSDGQKFLAEWPTELYADAVEQFVLDAQHPPEEVPRDEHGPGLSMICDSCPFAVQCWGPVAVPYAAPPQAAVANELGLEMVLSNYDEARERGKVAKADQDFWKTVLTGTPGAPYGEWDLGWTKPKPKPSLDEDEAVRLLTEAGLPVPLKTTTASRSIIVKRRKAEPAELPAAAPKEIEQ